MRSAYPDEVVIRPRRLPLLIVAGVAALAAVVVAGAYRTGQPLAAWFGIAMLIGCVPLADRLQRSIRMSPAALGVQQWQRKTAVPYDAIRTYGLRRAWSYRSGQWT